MGQFSPLHLALGVEELPLSAETHTSNSTTSE